MSYVIWEARYSTGNDSNGGGFASDGTGTDYSVQDAKNTVGSNISTTDAVANGTTTITSATAAFTSAITGNYIYLSGGSGSLAATRVKATYVSATSITVSASIAAGTGITMNIGGALKTPGYAASIMVASDALFLLDTAIFSQTSASQNVANGQPKFPAGTVAQPTRIQGYKAGNRTFENSDGLAILQLNVASSACVDATNNNVTYANIKFDGNLQTSSQGVAGNSSVNGLRFRKCHFANCTNIGMNGNASSNRFLDCQIYGCTTTWAFQAAGVLMGCEFYNNTGGTIRNSGGNLTLEDCLFYGNTGNNNYGVYSNPSSGSVAIDISHCTFFDQGDHGVYLNPSTSGNGSGYQANVRNSIFEAATSNGWGVKANTSLANVWVDNCSFYMPVGGGNVDTTNIPAGNVTNILQSGGTHFINAGGNDFRLNSTAGQGLPCQGTAKPSAFGNASATLLNRDLGPANSPAAAATYVTLSQLQSELDARSLTSSVLNALSTANDLTAAPTNFADMLIGTDGLVQTSLPQEAVIFPNGYNASLFLVDPAGRTRHIYYPPTGEVFSVNGATYNQVAGA